jgi:hypothetical protein
MDDVKFTGRLHDAGSSMELDKLSCREQTGLQVIRAALTRDTDGNLAESSRETSA